MYPDKPELAKALVAFQGEVENVSKDATNPFFKSKYASLENIISHVKPLLFKHGLAVSQYPEGDGLTTVLMHQSGQYFSATANLHAKDQTPQGQGSAITYMRRYALSAVLGIAADEDDDGNAATQKPPLKWNGTAPDLERQQEANNPKPPKVAAQSKEGKKKAIADLLTLAVAADPTNLSDTPKTKEDFEEAALRYTGLVLNDDTLDAVLKALIK